MPDFIRQSDPQAQRPMTATEEIAPPTFTQSYAGRAIVSRGCSETLGGSAGPILRADIDEGFANLFALDLLEAASGREDVTASATSRNFRRTTYVGQINRAAARMFHVGILHSDNGAADVISLGVPIKLRRPMPTT